MLAGYAKALIPQCPKEFRVSLAIFDLDNTLLHGDSDYLWGQFLVEQQIVDATEFAQANRYFYQQYEAGSLNISEYLEFSLSVLTKYSPDELHAWRQQFIEQKIKPIILPQGRALLDQHRQQGDTLLIITATNAGIGTLPTHGPSTASKNKSTAPAAKVDRRPRPPDATLMTDWPIIAQPPIPPKNAATILAAPCPVHSRCLSLLV